MTDSRLREIAIEIIRKSVDNSLVSPDISWPRRHQIRADLERNIVEALSSETLRAREEEREKIIREIASSLDLSVRAFESNTPLRNLNNAALLRVIQEAILSFLTPKESEEGK